uniref:Uncharacterized protein n=1 Tax=Setaria italica TaxID=4555 RepID=K4AH98_SETIT
MEARQSTEFESHPFQQLFRSSSTTWGRARALARARVHTWVQRPGSLGLSLLIETPLSSHTYGTGNYPSHSSHNVEIVVVMLLLVQWYP